MKALNVTNIFAAIVGNILIMGLATGCGTSNTKTYSTPPKGFTPTATIAGLSSTAQQAILGNYTGTLTSTDLSGENDGSQSFNLVLGQGQISGNSNTYVNMTLSSNGPAGTIADSELLDYYQAGTASISGDTRYVFYTTPGLIGGLSPTNVQLEIDIFLNTANQVDSSQSQIVIYDCGYGSCSGATYPDAVFSGLVKH
jgi:hypothetical protein